MGSRVVSVTEFKAKCLALLTDVGENGGIITITKRGEPLATVTPARKRRFKSSEGILAGKIHITDEMLKRARAELNASLRRRAKKLEAILAARH